MASKGLRTDFGEGNQLAAGGAGFIDPMDCLLDRFLKIEPARLSLDGCSLVFLDEIRHGELV